MSAGGFTAGWAASPFQGAGGLATIVDADARAVCFVPSEHQNAIGNGRLIRSAPDLLAAAEAALAVLVCRARPSHLTADGCDCCACEAGTLLRSAIRRARGEA